MKNVKRLILCTLPLITIAAQAGPTVTRGRVEIRPGSAVEVRPTAKTLPAERLLNAGSDINSLRAQLNGETAPIRSANAGSLTQEGAQKINAFTSKVLAKVLEKDQDKNVFFSGPVMVSAMTLLANGATGHGKEELTRVIGYDERQIERMNSEVSGMLSRLAKKSEGVSVKMGNAFFADDSLPVEPAYKALIQTQFKAEASNVSFQQNPQAATDKINGWASKATDGMITKVLDKDTASGLAALLGSSIYFKGVWASQFNKERTYEQPFRLNENEKVMVPMMTQTMDIDAVIDGEKVIARLPYKGGTAAMYIIIPKHRSKITPDEALLSAMNNKQLDLFKAGKAERFEGEDVVLPKFAIEYTNSKLKDVFETLGVEKVFRPGSLTALSSDPRLKVAYIRQDSKLEVDEEGARAAAVATIGMVLESMRMPTFQFDRPFAVVIRDEATGIDMFSGVIRNPKK